MSTVEPVFKMVKGNVTIPYVRVDSCTDVGTGEVASAHVTVNAQHGKYITSTPLDQFDLFTLTFRDVNNVVYERVMYLETILPQENTEGQLMGLELYGRENYLRKFLIPGHFIRIQLKDIITEIITLYNDNKGTAQPTITWDATDFPEYTYGTFDFDDRTDCYAALMQVISYLNLSVPAGGAGDYYELLFTDHSNGNLVMHVIPQGSRASTPHTIQGRGQDTLKVLEIKDAIAANIMGVRGAPNAGIMPRVWEEMESQLEEFDNFPLWDSTIAYKKGVHVRYLGNVYKATADAPAARAPTSVWQQVTIPQYVLRDADIASRTWNLQRHIKSYMGNSNASQYDQGFTSPCFPDSNLVIKEEGDFDFFRNFADHRAKSWAGVNSVYGDPREGVRVLVDSHANGSLGTPFGSGSTYGSDVFGVSYKDAVAQYDGEKWIVAFRPEKGYQVVVLKDGAGVFEYQGPNHATSTDPRTRRTQTATASQLRWVDIKASYLGYDCLHYPASITAVPTLLGDRLELSGNHATRVTYVFDETADIGSAFGILRLALTATAGLVGTAIASLLGLTITRDVYNFGWWCTLFEAPSPNNTRFGNTIGSNYKQPVLDLKNLNKTPSGLKGYDAADADELGPLSGIRFHMNFRILFGSAPWPQGDIPFRCTVYDTESNVWVRDFVYRHHGETEDITLLFAGFKLYRAREPIGIKLNTLLSNIITPEIHLWEVFEQRRVKRVELQLQLPYDSHGRFSPANFDGFTKTFLSSLVGTTLTTTCDIDVVGFTKSPYAIVSDGTSARKVMGPIKDYPNVVNYQQLKHIAQAELDLSKHRRDTFTIKVTGNCAIRAGDSIYLEDEDLTNRDDKPDGSNTVDNTIKLAVRKVSHRINAEDQSAGGHTTEISVYRRINA